MSSPPSAEGSRGASSDESRAVVTAYIALGANLGDRLASLRAAVDALEAHEGVRVVRHSSVYDTSPVGPPNQPHYLNAVVGIETELSPAALLASLLDIERQLGRTRSDSRWTARTIDLDLILYGDFVCRENNAADSNAPSLEVPHPRFRERAFVLLPLAEIASSVCDPVTGEPVESLLRACPGRLDAIRVGPLVCRSSPS